ncbi:hypothetical protein [Fictibacillus fluitans]|uniref:Uncharacterized protein n=1 Tax=Fictibacillus fluitans TaxID=3058422 RepID=A0ABT8HQY7_9BACL|nr:hypothetical protein [Fictibacillus sp. NE201]MDN4523182.1 hypothetical protein [Fictibacillus sp. NE201]
MEPMQIDGNFLVVIDLLAVEILAISGVLPNKTEKGIAYYFINQDVIDAVGHASIVSNTMLENYEKTGNFLGE